MTSYSSPPNSTGSSPRSLHSTSSSSIASSAKAPRTLDNVDPSMLRKLEEAADAEFNQPFNRNQQLALEIEKGIRLGQLSAHSMPAHKLASLTNHSK